MIAENTSLPSQTKTRHIPHQRERRTGKDVGSGSVGLKAREVCVPGGGVSQIEDKRAQSHARIQITATLAGNPETREERRA